MSRTPQPASVAVRVIVPGFGYVRRTPASSVVEGAVVSSTAFTVNAALTAGDSVLPMASTDQKSMWWSFDFVRGAGTSMTVPWTWVPSSTLYHVDTTPEPIGPSVAVREILAAPW